MKKGVELGSATPICILKLGFYNVNFDMKKGKENIV